MEYYVSHGLGESMDRVQNYKYDIFLENAINNPLIDFVVHYEKNSRKLQIIYRN